MAKWETPEVETLDVAQTETDSLGCFIPNGMTCGDKKNPSGSGCGRH